MTNPIQENPESGIRIFPGFGGILGNEILTHCAENNQKLRHYYP